MRKLTIKRNKAFAGCLAKTKIYITGVQGEILICGKPCTYLGELKNGEEKTFEIPTDQVEIYAICDSISKEFCNDLYVIEQGEEDVVLTGKNKLNLSRGNAFLFDNNNSAQALENRKKGNKKGSLVLIISIVVGAVIGGCISMLL